MQRCYHCRLRMVYRDDGGPLCLACGRLQVSPAWMPSAIAEDVPALFTLSYRCERCGTEKRVRWPSQLQRFCSRSCRTTAHNRGRRLKKPWRELQIA